ncbi:MAG: phosphatase PAP2 family protein [Magnetospirillum sp.]|nr:phosphatase PAP2 family protein [Magnetospirillum sp.]
MRTTIYLGLLILAVVAFTAFPGIDLAVTRVFYRSHLGFFLYTIPVIRFVHDAVPPLTVALSIFLVLATGWSAWTRRAVLGLSWRKLAYLLMVLAVGPGLLVNVVFKEHWGRARPSQVVEFGGTKTFSPALAISDQCHGNCSFVSGHAAMGFYPVALAFVIGRRRRVLATAGGILLGGAVGAVRIMEGGHFLSDVVFSGLVVYGCSWGLARVMLAGRDPTDSLGRA